MTRQTAEGRTPRAGERIDPHWQPRHTASPLHTIETIAWRDWTFDADRPLAEVALAFLRDARNRVLARRTVEGYDDVAARFIHWVEADRRGRTTAPAVATVADLHTERIHAYLKREATRGGGRSVDGQRSEGGALRTLATFGIEIGALADDALRAFQLPKKAEREDDGPSSLSDAETRRLLRHLADDTSYEGARLYLWCCTMIDTGIRPAELASLRLATIDRETRSLRILGKGARNRTLAYGEQTAKALERYRRFRGETDRPELFLGHRGPMTEGSFSHAFGELATRIGLVAEVDGRPLAGAPTQYVLRRTFARRFADNGGDVEELARLMGHAPSSIPMLLERYYRPSWERLARAHRAARPLDGLFDAEAA